MKLWKSLLITILGCLLVSQIAIAGPNRGPGGGWDKNHGPQKPQKLLWKQAPVQLSY